MAIVTMVFDNGVRAVSTRVPAAAAVGLNDWYQEYVRVDCEFGTAILNHREIEVFTRQDLPRQKHREGTGQKIPLLVQPKWINTWLIEKFAQWRDGGPPMETEVQANVQASALVFGSIEVRAHQLAGEGARLHRQLRVKGGREWHASM